MKIFANWFGSYKTTCVLLAITGCTGLVFFILKWAEEESAITIIALATIASVSAILTLLSSFLGMTRNKA